MNQVYFARCKTALYLLLLTAGALLVHGYHPYAEDAEIYLPGVEKVLNPQLFPRSTEFFASHAGLTFFPNLIAFSLRITHVPFEAGLFLWHVVSIFLLLLACCELGGKLFPSERARWAGVSLIAALLTLPVAGTDLYIMDQYLNPRNLAAFAGIFAVTRTLEKKYVRAALWLAFALSVHPLMPMYTISFCLLLIGMERLSFLRRDQMHVRAAAGLASLLPFSKQLAAPGPAYHQAVMYHSAHYVLRWQWYEWLGILAPIGLLWWFGCLVRARKWVELDRVCRALIFYDLAYFVAALIISIPERFEAIARVQPLRSLHLLYILMFLIGGGLLGEYVLKARPWRWFALFLPLSAGMFAAQRALFPASAHIECPGRSAINPWANAFLWVRANTPVEARFVLDPFYMRVPGEDTIGFRALAERSRTVDVNKDSGAVSMFPSLAEEWWAQMQDLRGWNNFDAHDFAQLKKKYNVTWVVVQRDIAGLDCPYRNSNVRVCRVE